MFRFIASCFLAVCISASVRGQTVYKVNQYDIVYQGDLMPVFTLFTNQNLNSHWAFTNYFYVNAYKKNSWGEGLTGFTYTIVKGVSLGFLGGLQTNETELWRISPLVMLNNKEFQFFGGFEIGGKRHRWDAMGFYLKPPFKFGAELIRYYKMYATGPRMEFSFLKDRSITVFYSGLWDLTNDQYVSMFGIYFTHVPKL